MPDKTPLGLAFFRKVGTKPMKTSRRLHLLTALALIVLATAVSAQTPATLTDPRDGKTYRTVKIGEQVWMAENLNYTTKESRCYKDSAAYCAKYGRLYDWDDAMKACPAGWHLPTHQEWTVLIDFVGGEEIAGTKLKSKTGWHRGVKGYEPATDDYGFAALPGGYCFLDGSFRNAGNTGDWWNATEYDMVSDASVAWLLYMGRSYGRVYRGGTHKTLRLSVRCLRND